MNTSRPRHHTTADGPVAGGPGGEARQARRPPSQRQAHEEADRDYIQILHDAVVAAGHMNVPAVEDHAQYGRVLILPPHDGRAARIIRCEAFEGKLAWRWKDGDSPPSTADPIAFVDELDAAVSRLGVVLRNRASRSEQKPTP